MNAVASKNQKDNKLMLKKHQGSALMLALFIIIVLTLLGGALVKILSTSSETIAQEVIGTRALMAANSAMQAELSLLFPLSTDLAIPQPTGTCNATNTYDLQTSGNDIHGLYHCSATTTCDPYHTQELLTYYRLTSTGECGSSGIAEYTTENSAAVVRSSRTIQVEARSL
jgi:MSHA biogenesis protein MshP